MERVRVLIAEDQPTIRDALIDLIEDEPGLEVVAVADDATQAIGLARRTQPDVAVLDVRMPGGGGARAARGILRHCPRSNVVALSAHDDRMSVMEMLRSGARGYLLKGADPGLILSAIRGAARGEAALSAEVTGDIIAELAGKLRHDSLRAKRRARHSRRIRQVLRDGRLTMHFQPILSLDPREIIGVEALARFSGPPERPTIDWFEEAEAVGLRLDLELAAAGLAIRQLGSIPDGVYLSVNLSAPTAVSSAFMEMLDGVPGDRIVIEVTEHAPVEDYGELNQAVERLRDRGVRLAIDDAGAGFASLRHIVRLDPDIIKLDGSLTRGIDRDVKRRALASALIAFAREIEADIVAEGIESRDECEHLRALGVSAGQGYFLARPGPLPLGPV